MNQASMAALLTLAALATSCTPARTAINPAMASCVPPGATILAGIKLDQLRAAPLSQKLPAGAQLLVEALREATDVLLASDGRSLLSISRGPFRGPPAGAALLERNLAIAGPAELVRAATAQYKSHTIAASGLLARAEPLAAGNQVWIVVRGDAALPLSGNAANLNRLLHATEYATIAVQLSDRAAIDIKAVCRTPDAAQDFEQSVRAAVSLAAAANARQAVVAGLLRGIQIRRDDGTVHITLSAGAESIDALLRAF